MDDEGKGTGQFFLDSADASLRARIGVRNDDEVFDQFYVVDALALIHPTGLRKFESFPYIDCVYSCSSNTGNELPMPPGRLGIRRNTETEAARERL